MAIPATSRSSPCRLTRRTPPASAPAATATTSVVAHNGASCASCHLSAPYTTTYAAIPATCFCHAAAANSPDGWTRRQHDGRPERARCSCAPPATTARITWATRRPTTTRPRGAPNSATNYTRAGEPPYHTAITTQTVNAANKPCVVCHASTARPTWHWSTTSPTVLRHVSTDPNIQFVIRVALLGAPVYCNDCHKTATKAMNIAHRQRGFVHARRDRPGVVEHDGLRCVSAAATAPTLLSRTFPTVARRPVPAIGWTAHASDLRLHALCAVFVLLPRVRRLVSTGPPPFRRDVTCTGRDLANN